MESVKRPNRNIELLWWRNLFLESKFVNPFFAAFLISRGITEAEIFLLSVIYGLLVVALEIPTGYFGDLFGRRRSLIIGAVCFTIGNWVSVWAQGFWMFAFAQAVKGGGTAFDSGSTEAMIVEDTKRERGDVLDKYGFTISSRHIVKVLIPGVAGVFSLWYVNSNLYTILIWCSAISITLGLFPTWHLEETRISSNRSKVHFSAGLKPLKDYPALRLLMVHDGISGIASLIVFLAYIPRLRASGISDQALIVIYSVFHVMGYLNARFLAIKLDARFGTPEVVNTATALSVILTIAVAYFDQLWITSALMVLVWATTCSREVYYLKYSQCFIPDEIRATTNSMMSFARRLVEIPCLCLTAALATPEMVEVFLFIAFLNATLLLVRFPNLQKIRQEMPAAI